MNNNVTFTREQVLQSAKYRPYYDILGVVLEDDGQYTEKEIDEAVQAFLAKPIYEQVNGGNR